MSPEVSAPAVMSAEYDELRRRVDLVEAEMLRMGEALADCVVRLGKTIVALQDQVTMIREAAGLVDDRRAS